MPTCSSCNREMTLVVVKNFKEELGSARKGPSGYWYKHHGNPMLGLAKTIANAISHIDYKEYKCPTCGKTTPRLGIN